MMSDGAEAASSCPACGAQQDKKPPCSCQTGLQQQFYLSINNHQVSERAGDYYDPQPRNLTVHLNRSVTASFPNVNEEATPLLAPPVAPTTVTKVFWYRWYVLLVYCCLVTQQGAVWNHWGPISDSMQAAYSWNDATLSLLPFWGPAIYVLTFYPWTVFMLTRGLRYSGILSALFVTIGCLLKSVPFQSNFIFLIMCHACGILNGLAGPVVTAACTKLAAEWFPMNERVTAVALATMSQSLGPTLSFLIGPTIVQDAVSRNFTNHTDFDPKSLENIRHQVALYNYIDLGISALLFLLIIVYFPNRPRLPPSISCQVARDKDKGLKDLGLNTWLAVLGFGMPNGITNSYSAIFDVNMQAYNVDQKNSDWMGFASSAASMLLILIAGRLVDCFQRPRMSLFSTVLLIISTLSFVWFTLMCDILPSIRTLSTLYVSNTLAMAAQTATTPLFYEMACESAFPVQEETTTMVVTTCSQGFSALFLVFLFFKQTGTTWMNYATTASVLLAVPLACLFKDSYRRREYDLQQLTVSIED